MAALRGDVKALVGVLTAANSLRSPVWIMNPVNALSISLQENAGGDTPFAADIAAGTVHGLPADPVDLRRRPGWSFSSTPQTSSRRRETSRGSTCPIRRFCIWRTRRRWHQRRRFAELVAAPARSLWQTDTLGIRMMLDINWAMRRTGVIAWTQAVTW